MNDGPGPGANAGHARQGDVALVRLGLVALVLVVFAQSVGFEFVNYDDPSFVVSNPHLEGGLTLEGLRWAFSVSDVSQYHPLTWVSFMVDRELFGLEPAGYHLVNVLLHLAATLMLFALLRAATGSTWRSALVAALWAVHPLRAESVAWVAERKDVLSAFLGLATLRLYVAHAARPTARRFAGVAALFTLGLLAKPMLVTLPAVMLLMDFWPLGRLAPAHPSAGERLPWRSALAEKLPLLALAAASGVATLLVQERGAALRSVGAYPLAARLSTAVAGYGWYVGKLFVPSGLAVFYPYDRVPGFLETAALAAALGLLTAWAVMSRRTRPYLAVGWGFFLVMLLPVVGLLQVGSQRVADRYSYLPHIGLLVALVWLAADLLPRTSAAARRLFVAAATAVCLGLASLGFRQVGVFSDSVTLMTRALQVTENNYLAHTNLAAALAASGRVAEAELHYREALRILPAWEIPHFGLAVLLEQQERLGEAADQYRLGLASRPSDAMARRRLGSVLLLLGRREEGEAQLREAARLGDAEAARLLGAGRPARPTA